MNNSSPRASSSTVSRFLIRLACFLPQLCARLAPRVKFATPLQEPQPNRPQISEERLLSLSPSLPTWLRTAATRTDPQERAHRSIERASLSTQLIPTRENELRKEVPIPPRRPSPSYESLLRVSPNFSAY